MVCRCIMNIFTDLMWHTFLFEGISNPIRASFKVTTCLSAFSLARHVWNLEKHCMDLQEILGNCTKYFQSVSLYIKNRVHILVHACAVPVTMWTIIKVGKIKLKFIYYLNFMCQNWCSACIVFAPYPRSNVIIKYVGNTCDCSAVARICRRADSLKLLYNAYIS